MDIMVIGFNAGIGAISCAALAALGYVEAVSKDKKEAFDKTKAGYTIVSGFVAGGIIGFAITEGMSLDAIMPYLEMAGFGISLQYISKAALRKILENKK